MGDDPVLPVEEGEVVEAQPEALSPMQELARKLEELKRRIARPD
jgi:hypothetical protein